MSTRSSVRSTAATSRAPGSATPTGYHSILATRAGTGEVLHIRARKGSANTACGALRFVEELIPRVGRAGAAGPKLLRADLGLWNKKLMARLETAAGATRSACAARA